MSVRTLAVALLLGGCGGSALEGTAPEDATDVAVDTREDTAPETEPEVADTDDTAPETETEVVDDTRDDAAPETEVGDDDVIAEDTVAPLEVDSFVEDTGPEVVIPAPCTGLDDGDACDDGNACTTGDRCQAGACRPDDTVRCDDGNPCTDDRCEPATGCEFPNNLAGCDDGDPCTSYDRCIAGTCRAGTALCDDGNPCTRDVCDAGGGCTNTPDDTLPCEDGSACTAADSCSDGVCVGGLVDGCALLVAADPCATAVCGADGQTCDVTFVSNVPCDDGDLCTVGDRCVAGLCKPTGTNTCGWDTECAAFHCDPTIGCVLDQAYDAGKTCSDNDRCTTGDVCDGQGACLTAGVLDCDDDNACTQDNCSASSGCWHSSRSGPCDDGNLCTAGDYCSIGQCRGGTTVTCSDGDACTIDSCDPLIGCEVAPRVCDDGNACTADRCDMVAGCVTEARAGPCEDGLACTSGDTCVDAVCVAGAVTCDDGDPCTIDVCDREEGCVGDPICDALAGEGCSGEVCLAPASRLAITAVSQSPLRVTITNTSGASFRLGGFGLDDGAGDVATIGPADLVIGPGEVLVGARPADVEAVDADFVIDDAGWTTSGGAVLLAPGGAVVMTWAP